MLDAVVFVVHAVVVAIDGMSHVTKTIPLARALRVPPYELVIVPDGEIVNDVFEGRSGEEGWTGELQLQVEVEDRTPDGARHPGGHTPGCEEVEAAELVRGAPEPP
jgi:hypothetical protein